MKLAIKNEMKGFFRLTKHNESGECTHDTGWFQNLILYQGITELLKYNNNYCFYRFLKVGTGTSEPTPQDTSIQQVASAESTTEGRYWTRGFNSTGGYHYARGSVQFGKGVAAGVLSEVAAGWGNGANQIFSRALILDSQGQPTSIVVLENEFLTLEYELRNWHVVPEPHLIDYDDDGVTKQTLVTYTAPATDVGAPTGMDGVNNPFNVTSGAGSYSTTKDTSLAHLGVLKLTLFYSLNQGNPSIASIALTPNPPSNTIIPYGGNQRTFCTFSPPIPKTNEFVLSITITITFERRE